MQISLCAKITGLNEKNLNQGEFDLIDETQDENFFNQLEKSSFEDTKDKMENHLVDEPCLEDEGQLTVDVFQTPDEVVVQSTIAGIKKKDLNIAIEEDIITIKGERKKEKTENTEYLHQECFWGKFSRSIVLPHEIESEQIKATLKSGVLTIILPKAKKSSGEKLVGINSNKRGKKLK